MARLLSIETATDVCSVAISEGRKVLSVMESADTREHSSLLFQYIEETLKIAGIKPRQLNAVAVSMGPGSYTGLRIGVSAAKGLCFSLGKPMIAVSTLQALALQAIPFCIDHADLLCPMIDARRMEVFTALYNLSLNRISPDVARIIDTGSFDEYQDKRIALFGNGSEKYKSLLPPGDRFYYPNMMKPSAVSVAVLAEEKFSENDFVDAAYFEPFYLKEFVAGIPKVKGLHS